MDRREAMTMLKELVANDLVEQSYVSICERSPAHFQIQIKCNYRRDAIFEFAKEKGLTIIEDKDQKYLVIYRE